MELIPDNPSVQGLPSTLPYDVSRACQFRGRLCRLVRSFRGRPRSLPEAEAITGRGQSITRIYLVRRARLWIVVGSRLISSTVAASSLTSTQMRFDVSRNPSIDGTSETFILTVMRENVSALERAFELAATGRYATAREIRLKLAREGYQYQQVQGPTLRKHCSPPS